MRPIARETIIDRRQPALRWSAVIAAALVAITTWVVLQLIGIGGGLAAIELDSSGSVRNAGIGTTVGSILAPLIAMFVGGLVAGRLSTTFDAKTGAMHGFVTWAIASLAGVVAVAWLVSTLASGAAQLAYGNLQTSQNIQIDPDYQAEQLALATKKAGQLLLGAGLTLLVSLGAAAGGGALAARRGMRRPRHRTEEVPVVPPPAEPPADAPHVNP